MSEQVLNLVNKLAIAAKISEEIILQNIEETIKLGLATEEEIENIINKMIE